MTETAGCVLTHFELIENAEKFLRSMADEEKGGTGIILTQEEIQQCVDPAVLLKYPGDTFVRVWGSPEFLGSLINGG